jgi:hypothetical protein
VGIGFKVEISIVLAQLPKSFAIEAEEVQREVSFHGIEERKSRTI